MSDDDSVTMTPLDDVMLTSSEETTADEGDTTIVGEVGEGSRGSRGEGVGKSSCSEREEERGVAGDTEEEEGEGLKGRRAAKLDSLGVTESLPVKMDDVMVS